MAAKRPRQRKGEAEEIDGDSGATVAAGHNGIGDSAVRAFLDGIISAKKALENATAVQKTANGEYRNKIKNAVSAGMNKNAIMSALREIAREDEEIVADRRAEARYLRLLGCDIGTQLGLFDDQNEAVRPSAFAIAFAQGFDAGRVGKGSINDNPYDAAGKAEDQSRHEQWDKGWAVGQQELGGTLFKGNGKGKPSAGAIGAAAGSA
jgi:hypothetical protein